MEHGLLSVTFCRAVQSFMIVAAIVPMLFLYMYKQIIKILSLGAGSAKKRNMDLCKNALLCLLFIALLSGCTQTQTFVVSDYELSENISERQKQIVEKGISETEFDFVFYDEDIKVTFSPLSDKVQSFIFKNVGNDIYRFDNGSDVLELKINKVIGYITSCELNVYDKDGDAMIWNGKFILKRK